MSKPNNTLKLVEESATPTPQLYSRSHRLRNIFDCNRLTAKLINACLMGKMEESRATRIVYMIGVLMKGHELGVLEARIGELEKGLEERTNGIS